MGWKVVNVGYMFNYCNLDTDSYFNRKTENTILYYVGALGIFAIAEFELKIGHCYTTIVVIYCP